MEDEAAGAEMVVDRETEEVATAAQMACWS